MRTLIYALFAWILALSFLTAFQYHQIQSGRAQARSDAQGIWKAVVCSIEGAELRSPKITAHRRTVVAQFWTQLLVEQVGTSPCSTH